MTTSDDSGRSGEDRPDDSSSDYWRDNPDGSRSPQYPDWQGSQGSGQPPAQTNPYETQGTSGQPPTPPPYGQPTAPPAYGQGGYGQGQPAYGQGQPQWGQPGYGAPQAQAHPSATTAMVLGLIGLVGIMFCGGITLVLSPFAWVIGGRAVKEIDANPGRYSGRDQAQGGRIMGIIGTVLLILGVIGIVLFIGLIAVGTGFSESGTSSFVLPLLG